MNTNSHRQDCLSCEFAVCHTRRTSRRVIFLPRRVPPAHGDFSVSCGDSQQNKRKNVSVLRFLSIDIQNNFRLPLSEVAGHQLHDLILLLDSRPLVDSTTDVWTYIWGTSMFTSKQAYT